MESTLPNTNIQPNPTSPTTSSQEVGYVLSILGSIIYLDGLPRIRVTDLIENEQGLRAVISGLSEDKVEAWILDEGVVLPGQLFKKSAKKLKIPATPSMLGRAVNALGVPIDGKGPISKTRVAELNFEIPAKPLSERSFIDTQLVTGMSLIDTLIPIGKGQRELILGDPHSGKTSFLIDIISSVTQQGMICIFASIGKPIVEVRRLINLVSQTKALAKTIFLAATATDTAPLIFLTPQAAMSLAEYFQLQGLDVVVILDDLGIHAKVYRELSLLSGRVPGRESYPADIFYVHSHLLERAGKFSKKSGGGSITALPVAELALNDFTTYIPTNLMSMTDGHLLFKSSLRSLGQRPSIDISLSVSRVGRQTQSRVQTELSLVVRQVLSEAVSLDTLSRFSGELPPQTQSILQKRDLILEALKQEQSKLLSPQLQTVILSLIFTSFFTGRDAKFLSLHRDDLTNYFLNPKMKSFLNGVFLFKKLPDLTQELEKLIPSINNSL